MEKGIMDISQTFNNWTKNSQYPLAEIQVAVGSYNGTFSEREKGQVARLCWSSGW